MLEYLSKDQIQKLTRECKRFCFSPKCSSWAQEKRKRYWLTFLTLRYTAARISEIASYGSYAPVFDLTAREMEVITLKQKNGNGRPPRRVIPLPAVLTKALAEYSQGSYPCSMDTSNFRKFFKARCLAAGIPARLAHPHSLRHFRARELLRAGVDLQSVSQILGHASVATTTIYTRLSKEDIKMQMEKAGTI